MARISYDEFVERVEHHYSNIGVKIKDIPQSACGGVKCRECPFATKDNKCGKVGLKGCYLFAKRNSVATKLEMI